MHKKSSFSQVFGPGIIMASSCVGGSHIIASTQAGAYYGWQLAGLIVLVNVLKYPFFRIAFDYSSLHGKTLLEGYAERGGAYLWLFLVFNLFATVVNIAGGTLLSAVLLGMLLPQGVSQNVLNITVLASFVVLLFSHQYRQLDRVSKAIMLLLTLITLVALLMALGYSHKPVAGFTEPSPWTIGAVPFLAALMGWMPAPMELSVASSMWVKEKNRLHAGYRQKRMVDFNTSYVVTVVLALMFMLLGAWVQYGQNVPPLSGGKFIGQFVDMYAAAIGNFMRIPMVGVAFACIYGTTIVAVDGYSRCNQQTVALLLGSAEKGKSERTLRLWIVAAVVLSFVLIQFFSGAIGKMIPFAMTASFLSAPVFAWLNLGLLDTYQERPRWLLPLAWLGLSYLVAMVVVYLLWA